MENRIKKTQQNTYKIEAKPDYEDRIEIEIGDEKQSDFKPQVKLKRWDNETNLSVRLKTSEQLQEHTQKVKYIENKGEDSILLFDKNYSFDEVWIYNVLSHVDDAKKIIDNAKQLGKAFFGVFNFKEENV